MCKCWLSEGTRSLEKSISQTAINCTIWTFLLIISPPIFPSFSECSALEYFDIFVNKYFDDIGLALSPYKKLNHLNVSSNQFTYPVPSLPMDFLEFLYLAGNKFHGQIPEQLADLCTTIVKLDLSSNSLTNTIGK
ncbi:hypothetical protein K1719_006750 [Acacia pycnantha]|nr:hypothetical protein K1719_006750 [Acacia pycnantha]